MPDIIEIKNTHCTAKVALQGAQVLTWVPNGQKPVIWLSREARFEKGKSARGGVPICWPWFGPHLSNPSFPSHGFARASAWELLEQKEVACGATELLFRLAETSPQWPHPTELTFKAVLGESIEMTLTTRNTGKTPFTITQALHTYFEVGDVGKVSVHGLENCAYLDKVDAGKMKTQEGAVTISAEVDRIYLDTAADCIIEDPVLQRKIRIEKKGSHSTVVWNPWIEKAAKMGDLGRDGHLNMLCVESTNAASDSVTIEPSGSHSLWVRYSLI